jgi:endonuclease G
LERRSRTEAVEGFVLGAYRTFQVSVADLADATGFDLSRYVPHDPLGAPSEEGPRQGEPVFVPLDSAQEMVL